MRKRNHNRGLGAAEQGDVMKRTIGALAGIIATLGMGAVAHANLMSVSYQGFVTQGSDIENYFGGGDLTGDAFTATFLYDPTSGVESSDGVSYDEVDGGLGYLAPAPITSASLQINGQTYSSPTGLLWRRKYGCL